MGPTGRSPRVAGREICVGLVYLDKHRAEESPGRGALLERRYVTALEDREGFWKQLHAAARAVGVLDQETIVRLSDGGAYFIEHSNELLRDQPLVEILDIQHARQHVWEAGAEVQTDKDSRERWVKPFLGMIAAGHIKTLLATLAAKRGGLSGKKQCEAVRKLIGYVERHQHMMDYPSYNAAGYPIASGAIESANKRLVGRRCKQGGMIWSVPGLEHMCALRSALLNTEPWGRLWPHASDPRRAAA